MTTTDYDAQAAAFVKAANLEIRKVHKGDRAPNWVGPGEDHGDRYRVTILRRDDRTSRFSFDFWDSIAAREAGKPLTDYGVLSCISLEAFAPETFEDFCSDFGYDSDSRKAMRTFKALRKMADKMQAFFTPEELEQLAEIQ